MNDIEETKPLFHDEDSSTKKQSIKRRVDADASEICESFNLLCILFSLNHSCVVACLSYASTELGDHLSSVCNGILYVSFAMSAFLISNPLCVCLGWRDSLLIGMAGYCTYTAGFEVSVIFIGFAPDVSWLVACLAAAVGGLAGGLLWTSQGRSFARHSALVAEQTGAPLEQVTTEFAAIFAAYFLGSEVAAKLLATFIYLLFPPAAPFIIYAIYTIVAVSSCLFAGYLDELGDVGTYELSYRSISFNVGAAAKLIYKDTRLLLLVPYQVTFGFTSSLVQFYVMGTVIADSPHLGKAWVGFMAALLVFSAAAVSLCLPRLTEIYGKNVVIAVGNCTFIFSGLVFYLVSDAHLGTWVLIVPYMLVFGIARGIWENTNKSVIADFFGGSPDPAQSTTAFAAVAFFTGYSTALGYFTFYSLPRADMGLLVLGSAAVSLTSYQFAFLLNSRIKSQALLQERHRASRKRDLEDTKRRREEAFARKQDEHAGYALPQAYDDAEGHNIRTTHGWQEKQGHTSRDRDRVGKSSNRGREGEGGGGRSEPKVPPSSSSGGIGIDLLHFGSEREERQVEPIQAEINKKGAQHSHTLL